MSASVRERLVTSLLATMMKLGPASYDSGKEANLAFCVQRFAEKVAGLEVSFKTSEINGYTADLRGCRCRVWPKLSVSRQYLQRMQMAGIGIISRECGELQAELCLN